MAQQRIEDRIRQDMQLPVSRDDAFRAFVERFSEWWPPVFTFAGEDLAWIGFEPRAGGRCLERDNEGNELVWGEVLRYEPGERIVFSWWISPDRTIEGDPARASVVDVRFSESAGGGTRVEFEHRGISNHAGDWQMMAWAMAQDEGWPGLLRHYAAFASS